MQTLSYNYKIERVPRQENKVVDLAEYRRNTQPPQRQEQGGLPPLPRRARRLPLGVRLADLVSIAMVAMTLAATGMLVTVM